MLLFHPYCSSNTRYGNGLCRWFFSKRRILRTSPNHIRSTSAYLARPCSSPPPSCMLLVFGRYLQRLFFDRFVSLILLETACLNCYKLCHKHRRFVASFGLLAWHTAAACWKQPLRKLLCCLCWNRLYYYFKFVLDFVGSNRTVITGTGTSPVQGTCSKTSLQDVSWLCTG
jgi:hypothetical protein